ncbi:hypothetical protein B0I35DRAFT_450228 [Stachybotrys elegans]|uniref:NAD(P)-binding protein n=1 Tax=Stachybotrys elegans TaxID=80388 RepID=A0A8K0SUE6_9HYPO|nr:hypothetical protein B0I35DRAFT_450228 [Stachybotrys elegans]
MAFHPDDLPDLSGRVYIVTGASSGIGYHTAVYLAQKGARVYVCARSEAKGETTVASIRALHPAANIEALIMDHGKLATVIAAAKTFASKETALHGLVNNAGIMATPFALTEDGYEAQFQTNYIAHWLFTYHLLPILRETAKNAPAGSVRIVNLTSAGEQFAPSIGINFQDTSLPQDSAMARYGQSKLVNILHAKTLHERYGPAAAGDEGIWTAAVHPGFVWTNLAEGHLELPWWMRVLAFAARMAGAFWPPDKGAWTSVYCVASPEMKREHSGHYFERIAQLGSESAKAKDMALAEKLDEWTRKEMEAKGFL